MRRPRGNAERWLARQSGAGGFAAALDPPEKIRGLDWAARQIATTADADRLYVSNRFQTSAFEIKSGKRLWQSSVGGEHGETHEWTLTPMRPLALENRVFVRRLTRGSGTGGARQGKRPRAVAHAGRCDRRFRSGMEWRPAGGRGGGACRLGLGIQLYGLRSADRRAGAQQRLAVLHNSWFESRVCQFSAVQENYLMLAGGTVVCCDPLGKVRWVRRQEWLAPQVDHDWGRQYQQPALVVGDKLLVTQPGVEAVECLDLSTGVCAGASRCRAFTA